MIDNVVTEGPELLKQSPGRTTKISHKIETGDATPIRQRPYRYSPKVLEAMHNELRLCLQANPVERANRNLKQLIVSYIQDNHQKWDEYLNEIQFALNTAVQNSTGFSPAYLNFGREPILPKSLRHQTETIPH